MLPRLHIVTDDAVLARPDFKDHARAIVQVGHGVALHVRGRTTTARRLYDIAGLLQPAARESGALLVINDRVDVALAARVPAVQLSDRSLPPDVVHRIAGPDLRIGRSAHNVAEVEQAAADGAAFVLLGTIWPSASHPGGPVGGTGLIRAAAAVGVPLIAIGGVTRSRVAEAVAAGAYGVAVISAVWGSTDTARSARILVEEVESNVEHG